MISILIIPRTRVDCPPLVVVVVVVEEFLLSFPNCFSPRYQRVGSFLLFSIYINRALASPPSLSPVLYSGSTYFFSRSVSPCLSRTTFVAPSLFSPSPTSARLPLRLCSARCFVLPARPLARSSPLAPTLFRIYVRYSGCYKLCHFIGEKHSEKACTSG